MLNGLDQINCKNDNLLESYSLNLVLIQALVCIHKSKETIIVVHPSQESSQPLMKWENVITSEGAKYRKRLATSPARCLPFSFHGVITLCGRQPKFMWSNIIDLVWLSHDRLEIYVDGRGGGRNNKTYLTSHLPTTTHKQRWSSWIITGICFL